MEITADIYAWLTSIDILPFDTTNFRINENGNVELTQELSNQVKNGCFFKGLFNKINDMLNSLYGNIFKVDEKVQNLDDINDNAIKLINWNIIVEFIASYYGINLDSDYKTMIIAGDQLTFDDFFEKLYEFYISLEDKIKKKKSTSGVVPKDKSVVEKVNERFKKDFNEDYERRNKKINDYYNNNVNNHGDVDVENNNNNEASVSNLHANLNNKSKL